MTSPLQDLTPAIVADAEAALANGSFVTWAYWHREMIVAALGAALRWKKEMDGVTNDTP